MTTDNSLDLLKKSVKISSYFARFTTVKMKSGDKHMAFCPLHDNKNTPAVTLDDTKNLWHCFAGCGGGSMIDLYALQHGLDVNDSAQLAESIDGFAREVGYVMPERTPIGNEISTRRVKEALGALAKAAHDHLMDGRGEECDAAYDYLTKTRKFSDEVLDKWVLGVIPSGDKGVKFVLSATGDEKAAIEGGALARGERGGLYSPFAGRLLVPIRDTTGAVVGFGGRIVPGITAVGKGKWINPSENRVYSKSKIVFGIDLLGRNPGRVAVVEGYFDVIGIHETEGAGLAVACCGTAITPGHAEILSAAEEVVALFDGDTAGRKALSSSFWLANKLGDRVRAAVIAGGADPADLAFGTSTTDADHEALVELLARRTKPLLSAAVEERYGVTERDSDFDRWISTTVATLTRTDHKDQVIRTAAGLRSTSVSTYARNLTTASISVRSNSDDPVATGVLDSNMASILRRLLQMTEVERTSVVASLSRWNANADGAVRNFLPVSTEHDLEAFGTVAVGGSAFENRSGVIDRTIAALLPAEDADVEDISTPLRNMITLMAHDGREICGSSATSPWLTASLLGLRRINGSSRSVEKQPTVLAYLIDLALDIERHRRTADDSTLAS